MDKFSLLTMIVSLLFASGCGSSQPMLPDGYDMATFGGGCFWCSEAVFQRLEGVVKVESGYSGGIVPYPTSTIVNKGGTEYAEVIQITFDSKIISYKELLQVFFSTHDPTTLNRQGDDVGDQYRSVIFYHTDEQERLSAQMIHEIDSTKILENPIVTHVKPYSDFYKAEEYHQNYYNNNSSAPYCQLVINPKLIKLRKMFSGKLKKEAK